jgi:hypothetical protein
MRHAAIIIGRNDAAALNNHAADEIKRLAHVDFLSIGMACIKIIT